ncbi:MAG TPA: hypothetical protein VNO32_59965 [Candidatus Acidoferrum sp.]|nr:hypothetical protein [Candidatus Acidoferrum sp.]
MKTLAGENNVRRYSMPIHAQQADTTVVPEIQYQSHCARTSRLDGVIEEALERVRLGWQDRGYFNVTVSGDARTLAKNAADVHIALFVHVDEGPRYTLGGITFTHNKTLTDVWLANCYFAHNSVGLSVLLGFCDAGSGRPFHPFHHYAGSLARTGWGPFRSGGVTSG